MHYTTKRIVVVLMSIMMVLSVFGGMTFIANADYAVGDMIEFGNYPQYRVTDSNIIAALNAQADDWQSYGYYSGTGNFKDGEMTPKDYMQYCDVTYGRRKYRGVQFSQYRPCYTGYKSQIDNSYQDENGYYTDTIYWFQYETLSWRVLDPDAGLVLCLTIIDSQPYNNFILESGQEANGYPAYWGDADQTYYANNYAESSLRQWLNDDFYNTAFTTAQQNKIFTTTLDNSAYDPSRSAYDSASTTDKVFLLSYGDVLNASYGFELSEGNSDTRIAQSSDYAKCQGLYVNLSYAYSQDWRLRAAGYYSQSACEVSNVGKVTNYFYVSGTHVGIRPALKLNLESLGSLEPLVDKTIIEYGSYPQRKVTDSDLIALLNTQAADWQSYGYSHGYLWPDNYMQYCDVTYGEQKYRGVQLSRYRPYYVEDTDNNNTYQDDNGYAANTVYWFQYEPLQWRVLDPDTGLVLCDTIIDSQPYNDYILSSGTDAYGSTAYWGDVSQTHYANNYAESSLRQWLNEDFYNTAFTTVQQYGILSTTLDNSPFNTFYSDFDSETTTDKVFLLSYSDMSNTAYGFSSDVDNYSSLSQRTLGSDYAVCQGLYVDQNGCSYWRLRSAGIFSNYSCAVNCNGWPLFTCDVNGTYIGVRPALKLTQVSLKYETIEYGSYPQSKVTDSDLIAALNGQAADWQSYGYYTGTGDPFDGNMAPSGYMEYIDIEYSAQKYRGVRFSEYRSSFFSMGYMQHIDNPEQYYNGYSTDTVYWFQYEPLQWRVLDPSTGLVLCETIIDSQSYNNYILGSGTDVYGNLACWGDASQTYYANNYAESSLRKWLNDDFYNTAFTAAQQNRILPTTLDNSAYDPSCSAYDSETTTDKIFLLSYSDTLNSSYGFSSSATDSSTRQTQSSDYAKCQGLYVESSMNECSDWWLRSAGNVSHSACRVGCDGWVYDGWQNVFFTCIGVRPALKLNLKSPEYKTIEYGSYPQTNVTDFDLIAALNTQAADWQSYRYYSGTYNIADGQMIASDYMQYCDVIYGVQKYRGVKFSQYRPYITGDGLGTTASDQIINGYAPDTVYWFQYEPLQWRVLDPSTGLVLCETIIDSQPYNNYLLSSGTDAYGKTAYWGDADQTHYANNYAESSLRQWLNAGFANTAFTAAQRDAILPTTLDNSAYDPSCSAFSSATTTDKIFLLSYSDTLNTPYGFLSDTGSSSTRQAQGSDYAMCQGLHVVTSSKCSNWWLRSAAGGNSQRACCVSHDGWISSLCSVGSTSIGVRPAITLDLQAEDDAPNDSINVTITDGIGVNFYLDFDASSREDVDSATVTYKNFSDETVTETYTKDALPVEDGRYKLTVWIAPAQLADVIIVNIGNAEYCQSVLGYCEELKTIPEHAAYFPFVNALEQYAQAANNTFSYTDDEIADIAGLNHQPVQDYTGARFTDGTGKVTGASFMALTKPEFRFYTSSITEAQAVAYNQAGVSATMDGGSDTLNARFVKKADNSVLLEVTGVSAENMDKTITVTVTGLGTITFNGNAFARAMARNSSSETQQNLGAALYNYGAAAKTCFGA